MSRGDLTQYDPPTGDELQKFDRLLISGIFNRSSYHIRSLLACVGWLKARQYDVSIWIRNFRRNRSKLYDTLLEIQSNLTALYVRLDRLLGDQQSYFVDNPFGFPIRMKRLYQEFLNTNDGLSDVLEPYLNYANAYKTKHDSGEILDTSALPVKPEVLRSQLLEKLDLLQEVLVSRE